MQAAAAAAACDMLDSPLKTQREDEDATRWVEDPISIFILFKKGAPGGFLHFLFVNKIKYDLRWICRFRMS